MKKNEKEITNVAKGKMNEMNFQLDLEGMQIALHNRPPGSDFMCYLHDIQGKVVSVGLRLIKQYLKLQVFVTNNSLEKQKEEEEAIIKTGKIKRLLSEEGGTLEKMPSYETPWTNNKNSNDYSHHYHHHSVDNRSQRQPKMPKKLARAVTQE